MREVFDDHNLWWLFMTICAAYFVSVLAFNHHVDKTNDRIKSLEAQVTWLDRVVTKEARCDGN